MLRKETQLLLFYRGRCGIFFVCFPFIVIYLVCYFALRYALSTSTVENKNSIGRYYTPSENMGDNDFLIWLIICCNCWYWWLSIWFLLFIFYCDHFILYWLLYCTQILRFCSCFYYFSVFLYFLDIIVINYLTNITLWENNSKNK